MNTSFPNYELTYVSLDILDKEYGFQMCRTETQFLIMALDEETDEVIYQTEGLLADYESLMKHALMYAYIKGSGEMTHEEIRSQYESQLSVLQNRDRRLYEEHIEQFDAYLDGMKVSLEA